MRPKDWNPEEETSFRQWYETQRERIRQMTGWSLNKNPDDPKHFYDYRSAYRAGASPTWQPEHQQFRWPDKFKVSGYPYD